MTGPETHAPLGTAGLGPNWGRGLRAGHAETARRCTKRHHLLWAQPGPWAVHWPRELRVDACTSRHRLPRDPHGTAGRERAGGAARLGAGATRRRMRHRLPQDPLGTAGREQAGGAARLPVDLLVYACICRGTRKGTVGCELARHHQ
jgi:hypothetical protein